MRDPEKNMARVARTQVRLEKTLPLHGKDAVVGNVKRGGASKKRKLTHTGRYPVVKHGVGTRKRGRKEDFEKKRWPKRAQ